MELLQEKLNKTFMAPEFYRDAVLQLESSLKGVLQEEEVYWKLKSRVQ